MALSDYTPESREVIVKGKALFSVEGLSLGGLEQLVRTHMPDLESVFDIIILGEKPGQTLTASLVAIATGIVSRAPGLASNIIAVACTEPTTEELVKQARRLPFPVQVDALIKIGELTFEENGGVKKSLESLVTLLARMRATGMPNQEALRATSSGTTTASDEM